MNMHKTWSVMYQESSLLFPHALDKTFYYSFMKHKRKLPLIMNHMLPTTIFYLFKRKKNLSIILENLYVSRMSVIICLSYCSRNDTLLPFHCGHPNATYPIINWNISIPGNIGLPNNKASHGITNSLNSTFGMWNVFLKHDSQSFVMNMASVLPIIFRVDFL